MSFDFRQFDRALEDVRNEVATANMIRMQAVKRYVSMLKAIDSFILLSYETMTDAEKSDLMAAFRELEKTIDCISPTHEQAALETLHVVNLPPKKK